MDSLNVLLERVRDEVVADSSLVSFAKSLKAAVPGTKGTFTVMLGDNFVDDIPQSAIPFFLVVVGDEVRREITAGGTLVTRVLLVRFGITDPDTDRGTEFITTLEELVVEVMNRILGESYIGPDNPEGLILDHDVIRIETDEDSFRPSCLRQLTLQVSYLLA